jgi:hypothetical protein
MSTVAIAALAAPAFALPDRFEQGPDCTGMGAQCIQESLRVEDGNRGDEKTGNAASDEGLGGSVDATAARDSGGGDNEIGDEVGGAADEAGDEISATADEAGDEISEGADEAGDEISEAADEAGDEIGDAAGEIGDAFD